MSNASSSVAQWSGAITPLCEGTQKLFKPIHLWETDRLRIRLIGDGRHFHMKAYGQYETFAGAASFSAEREFFSRIPEKERAPGGMGGWYVAATDFTVLVTNALWPERQLDIDDEAKQVYDYLLMRFSNQTVHAAQRAQFKIHGVLPEAPENFHDHPLVPLAPYQLSASYTTMHEEGAALFMEQGTGKTAVAIRKICCRARGVYKNEKRMYRVLIVCPKNVRANWEAEINKFATTVGKVAVMRGGQLDRVKLLVDALRHEDDCEWVAIITSYETLRCSWEFIKNPWQGKGEWDLVILDEGHFIKGTYSKRSNLCLQLREHSRERMILTGTPVCNGVWDLYAQLEFLGEGMSGFLDEKAFRNFYIKYIERDDKPGKKIAIGEQNLPILQERLARIAVMVTKKEALPNLPEKMYAVREVEMTKPQRKAYIDLAEQLALEIEADLVANAGTNETVTVNNVLVKLLRLAQVTSGFIAIDEQYDTAGQKLTEDRIRRFTPNPKLDSLMELIAESDEKSKIIVWATFMPDIIAISNALQEKGIKHVTFHGEVNDKMRDEAVKLFNGDPNTKVFVGNPSAGGVGVNLWGHIPEDAGTERDHGMNCDTVVYYSQNWSMPTRAQSEDRCHRRGTRAHVTYIDLVVPGTVDEEIRARVVGKRNTAMRVQDVREVLNSVLTKMRTVGGDE